MPFNGIENTVIFVTCTVQVHPSISQKSFYVFMLLMYVSDYNSSLIVNLKQYEQ